jgi:CubicO group peptidase (beta-lactamase class C family)
MTTVARSLSVACCLALAPAGAERQPPRETGDAAIASLLEPIRNAYHLPALGAALVTSSGLSASAVSGVRKKGGAEPASIDDLWHLGSDTKAMTATLAAMLVERGSLTWDSTIGNVFGDRAAAFPAAFRDITVAQLLSHHAGLPPNIDWAKASASAASPREQRLNALNTASATRLLSTPGSTYAYSNLGYVIAGAILERITDTPWETLIADRLFTQLGMKSCGFGGLGTPGKIDQPWPHGADGTPMKENGPLVDNPEVMGPAGTVHCSIADWSKFIIDHLRGDRGAGTVLKAETYRVLHSAKPPGDYAFGWLAVPRPWAGGTALTHAGSNTMNFCVVWIAPAKDFAVLAVTNEGGAEATKAADDAVSALILHQQRRP